MTTFNQCPNCKTAPRAGLFGDGSRTIFECKECGTRYCSDPKKCGGSRCPDCGSKNRLEIGKCHPK